MTTRRTRSQTARPPLKVEPDDRPAATSRVVADPATKLAFDALVDEIEELFRPLRGKKKKNQSTDRVPVQGLAALATRDRHGSKAAWTDSEKRAFGVLKSLGKDEDDATWSLLHTFSCGGDKARFETSFITARNRVNRRTARAATLLKADRKKAATMIAELKRRTDAEPARRQAQKKAKVAADARPATLVRPRSLGHQLPVAPVAVQPAAMQRLPTPYDEREMEFDEPLTFERLLDMARMHNEWCPTFVAPIPMQPIDSIGTIQLLDSFESDLPFEPEVDLDFTMEPFLAFQLDVKDEVLAATPTGDRVDGRNHTTGGL